MKETLHFERFLFLLAALILGACSVGDSGFDANRKFTFQESYNLDDTISVGFYQEHANAWKPPDSLFNHFRIALKNSGLPVYFSESTGHKQLYDFENTPLLHTRKIDTQKIVSIANSCANCSNLVMVPIVKVSYEALPADSDPEFICIISVKIFIVQDDKIIYFAERGFAEDGNEENFRNYDFPIPQGKWDRLARELMKVYIERLVWKG